MTEIDLSFTKDPMWVEKRRELWTVRRESLSSDFSKGDLDTLEHYFLTGELVGKYRISDGALFSYFPMQTPLGWDYVLTSLLSTGANIEKIIKDCFQDYSSDPIVAPYELARWEYFFGEKFESKIRSRVPIGNDEYVYEARLDLYETFCRVSTGFTGFLEYDNKSGDWPKWLVKQEYYWSMWPLISNECFGSSERYHVKTVHFINRLLKYVSGERTYKFDDPSQTRPKFIKMMEARIDELYPQLCSELQKLWDEARSKTTS